MKKIALAFALFAFAQIAVFAQSSICGKLTDPFGSAYGATVKVLKNDVFITGVATDDEGSFSISVLPDYYDLEFNYVGFGSIRIEKVVVSENASRQLDFLFEKPQKGAKHVDVSDRGLFANEIQTGENSIDISHLYSGIYFYRVFDGKK